MDDNVQALVADFSINLRRIEAQQQRLLRKFSGTFDGMERNSTRSLRSIERRAEQTSRNVRRALAAIAVGVAGNALRNYEEEWRNTTNTLKQFTDILGPAELAASDLNKVVTDAGAPLAEMGGLIGAATRAARGFDGSRSEILEFAEAVSKGAALANNGSAAVTGAITQLSQAIGSPVVQLGEFNSIIEGTPRLAQAFADGVEGAGGSLATLRRQISSGDVSGQQLFNGLISQIGDLRREFETLDQGPTEALIRLQNRLVEFVGTNETVKGAAAGVASVIDFVAENMDALTDAIIIGGAALGGFFGAQGLLAVAAGLKKTADGATAAAKAFAILNAVSKGLGGPVVIAVTALAAGFAALALKASEFETPAEKMQDRLAEIRGEMEAVDALLGAPFDEIKELASDAAAGLDALPEKFKAIREEMEKNGAAAKQLAVDNSAARQIELANTQRVAEKQLAAQRRRLADLQSQSSPPRRRSLNPFTAQADKGNAARVRAQTAAAEAEILRLETLLSGLEGTLAEAEAQTQGLLQRDREDFKEVPGPTREVKKDDTPKADKGAAEARQRALDTQIEQIRQLARTEIEQIELIRDQRLEAIDAAKLAEAERAQLVAAVNQQAATEISDIRSREAEAAADKMAAMAEAKDARAIAAAEGLAQIAEIESAVARMAGRSLEATRLQFEAERLRLEALVSGLDDVAAAEARVGLARLEAREAEFEKDALADIDALTGGDAESGLEGELARIAAEEEAKLALLETYRTDELERLRDFELIKSEIEAEADEARRAARVASFDTMIGAAEGFAAKSVAALRKAGAEGTKALRIAAKTEQGIALGRATVAAINAALQSYSNAGGFPFGVTAAGLSLAFSTPKIAALAAQTFSTGGRVRGAGTGTSDSIPILASNDEFMMRARVARPLMPALERLNAGQSPESAFGFTASRAAPNLVPMVQAEAARRGSTINMGDTSLVVRGSVDEALMPEIEKMFRDRDRASAERFNRLSRQRDRQTKPRHERELGAVR